MKQQIESGAGVKPVPGSRCKVPADVLAQHCKAAAAAIDDVVPPLGVALPQRQASSLEDEDEEGEQGLGPLAAAAK